MSSASSLSSSLPPSTSSLQPPTSAPSSSNAPPLAAAQTCLQASPRLSAIQAHGVCRLLGAMVVVQGQGKASTGIESLRSLRDALNDVLGDGGHDGGTATAPHHVRTAQSVADTSAGTSATSKGTTATSIATGPSAACAQVLHDPHLFTPIIGWLFHERHTLASRVALGQTALVSKEWRHISRQTCFWRPLVRELLPVVGDNDESRVQGRGCEGYFAFLARYGKCLVEKQVKTGDGDLFEGLEMHIEVWDAGVASTRIYSGMGPILASIVPGNTPEEAPTVLVRITGPHRKEMAGPPFSAADLDPVQRQYPTIVDCFQASTAVSNPLHLCMRVTVLDRQTGKMALVFEGDKRMKLSINSCAEWVAQYVPGRTYYARSANWTALHRRQADGSWSSEEEISAFVGFLLQALPDQEGVDETEKKHRAVIAPAFHSSFADMQFNVPEAKAVATFLRSLVE